MKGKPTPPQLIPYLQNKKEKFHKAQKESLHLSPHSFLISNLSRSRTIHPYCPSSQFFPTFIHAPCDARANIMGLFIFVAIHLQGTILRAFLDCL